MTTGWDYNRDNGGSFVRRASIFFREYSFFPLLKDLSNYDHAFGLRSWISVQNCRVFQNDVCPLVEVL
jgi:hypothetical protein